jgi:organic hydroperoxide reductase OsmC/OhrA
MSKTHIYQTEIRWSGNTGSGTSAYNAYSRNFEISINGKLTTIKGSSDAAFRGDPSRYNPEELLLSALSSCHMLWYLHLCAESGIIVLDYIDRASGIMEELSNGSGQFSEVTLYPEVVVSKNEMIENAYLLHKKAGEYCFIARSVNFPVSHQPMVICPVKSN